MAGGRAERLVLGINAAHDASACLLRDGGIVAAVAEERLSRRKHHRGFPHLAVDYCLRSVGRDLATVDAIVLNESNRTDFGLMLREHASFAGELIVNPSHHLLHAYYAVVASGFATSAVLVLDGSGYSYGEHRRRRSPLLGSPPPYSEMEESESAYCVGSDGELTLVDKRWGLWEASDPYIRFPSLGHMYSAASQYIFGGMEHAGKTMGLAPFGDASRIQGPIVDCDGDGLRFDTRWMLRLPPRSARPAHLDDTCRDLAAKVQAELEKAVLFLCRRAHAATGLEDLCISGGVGLNSVVNGRILRETPFRRLFVTPASGDSGIAIGAALCGHERLFGRRPTWPAYDNFHGVRYADPSVQTAIGTRRDFVRCERLAEPARAAARDIAEGRFVGWFEGASEFGPRALGHRSILCDPRPAAMRDRLNAEVKFRERFRPYAASVLAEHARECFDIVDADPFMMIVARVKDAVAAIVPSVVHVDGTCRIQTVALGFPGAYRTVLERFHELTGVPLVLNTSFNVRGEPIVETPEDALRCFLGCGLDVLYLEDRRITKIDAAGDVPLEELVLCLNDAVAFGSQFGTDAGAALEPEYYGQTATGWRAPLTADEHRVMQLIDGRRSLHELQDMPDTTADVAAIVASLRRRGYLSLKVRRG